MTVSGVLIVVMAVLFACGVYAMLERSLTRVLIGFLLLGNAVNLLLLIVMGEPGIAPFYTYAETPSPDELSDPLPQVLSLTSIVITFAVSAFLLALIYRTWQLEQQDILVDDEEDAHVRERTSIEDEVMEDHADHEEDTAATDFVDVRTTPITVLYEADLDAQAQAETERGEDE